MNQNASDLIIGALESRFTCKRYDPHGHVSDSDLNTILDAGRLSPSSFGLEPWKFLVIQDPDLVEAIRTLAWGAKRHADRTVVIAARRDAAAGSEWVHRILHDTQRCAREDEEARLERLDSFQRSDARVLESERTLFDWASRQSYLALSNMLTTAALLGVDATPIEGFPVDAIDELLAERDALDLSAWGVSVMVQFGVRDPSHRPHPKLRRPFSQVVEYVRPPMSRVTPAR